MGCACAIAALSHTHTNTHTHSSISVSRLVFKPSWKWVNAADSCQWASGDLVGEKKKKKFSSDLRFFDFVTTRRRSRPILLDYSWEHVFFFFKCQTSSLHADNARQGTWTQHSSSLNFEVKKNKKLHHFLAFFSLYAEVFAMNQTAGAGNAYRRCSKGGKVRIERSSEEKIWV